MKKLLNVLMTVVFTSSSLTVVACGAIDDKNKINNKLTNTQQEMIEGAEFISRLIIAARHENLNYNVNEILSMYLTPKATAMNMPVKYNVDGTSINLSTDLLKYKNLLAPNINKFDLDHYAGIFASYVMGMYENDFYDSIINGDEEGNYYFEDSFSKQGYIGYNKTKNNATGYAHGLSKNLELSANEERRNLAWAIQDTGALTNFLLHNGLDGGFVGDTNATGSPASVGTEKNGGTNGGSYLFYNSLLANGSATCNSIVGTSLLGMCKTNTYKVDNKLDQKLNYSKKSDTSGPTIEWNGQEMKFNSTGASWTQEAGNQNVTGFVSMFSSLLDSVSESINGANVLLQLTNYLFPLKTSNSSAEAGIQAIAQSLSLKTWNSIKNLDDDFLNRSQTLKDLVAKLDKAPPLDIGEILSGENIGANVFYKYSKGQDKENYGTNAGLIVEIIDELINLYNQSDNKTEFINELFIDKNSPFKSGYSLIINGVNAIVIKIEGLGEEVWDQTMLEDEGAIKWLQLMKSVYTMFSNEEYIQNFEDVEKLIGTFGDFGTINQLTYLQKESLLKALGFQNNKYSDNSIFNALYKSISNIENPGQKQLRSLLEGFMANANKTLNPLHKNIIQYVEDDKFWKKSNIKINTTDNKQPNGIMEFDLNYVGKGDSTSTASKQHQKVDVPLNFNPYQVDYSKYEQLYGENNLSDEAKESIDTSKVSAQVLGWEQGIVSTEEELIKYDGLGNYEDYENVNFTYKLRWENISKNPNSPYWVMTSLKSYDSQGNEFYNLY